LTQAGHGGAHHWALCKVWSEVEIVRRQFKQRMASQATIDHSVFGAIWGGKKGHAEFKKTIKDLTDG
jgi:hypothetical protein